MNEKCASTASEQQPWQTAFRSSKAPWFGFGVIPAIVVSAFVLLVAVTRDHTNYAGRATFVVHWNEMPWVPGDDAAEKLRENWRKNITSRVTHLSQSDAEISALLNDAENFQGNQAEKATMISEIRKELRVTLTKHDEGSDTFAIEFRSSDPKQAQNGADLVLQGCRSWLNDKANDASMEATGRSGLDFAAVLEKEDELEMKLNALEQNGSWESRHTTQAEIDELQLKKFVRGAAFLSDLAVTVDGFLLKTAAWQTCDGRRKSACRK